MVEVLLQVKFNLALATHLHTVVPYICFVRLYSEDEALAARRSATAFEVHVLSLCEMHGR